MITAGNLADIIYTLRCGIATVKVVELAMDNDSEGKMYTNALGGAAVLLENVERRLDEIVKEAVTHENH